tara:strand:- start:1425 stop:1670 length:246 start_codon:yes stop_codon:yes gene_type:complete
MAIQADNQTAPRRTDEVIDEEFTVKLVGLETTRQYRFQTDAAAHVVKDETQCPTFLTLRGPATIRGRNKAYKVESSGQSSS